MPERLEKGPLLIVAAMREELTPLFRRLEPAVADRFEGTKVFRSSARGSLPELFLGVTGDGPAKAARVARGLCERYRPAALVGIGAAGALTASLAPSDVVASARLIDGSLSVPAPDPLLLSRATAAGARPATLVTVRRPAATAAAKKELSRDAGELAAVDMESSGWASAASGDGVPFVVVRAILDAADEELPAYLAECVGPEGGLRRAAVVARALAHPSTLPTLVWMHRRLAACAERLAEFLVDGFFRCEKA
jgi:adenosylhomocysteine nucleosidase